MAEHVVNSGAPSGAQKADHQEGMPHEGVATVATTEGGAGEHHAEPAVFGMDATVWVSLAMAAFLAVLIWRKVPGLIASGLDKQIAAIKLRLEEAKQLRAEAEALRDEYARKIASVEQEAAAMVAHAEQEAGLLIAKAEADAIDLVGRRTKMAEDKIAAAERTALAAVRAKAADAATRAATALLASKHDAGADKPLVDATIAGLGRLN
jgi:F-type H+-transporting ATPase subunit b